MWQVKTVHPSCNNRAVRFEPPANPGVLKMNIRRLAVTLATALALGLTATATMAETTADMSFDGMVATPRIDKNKDGMVSKKEFLDMMSAVWDEKAKKMSIKSDRMSAEDFRQILMYLKAGS
jgi:hypothetical protein